MGREELFRTRMEDLADIAYNRGIVTFSDFLDLYELHMLHSINWRQYGVTLSCSGGYDLAERQMAAFLPDALLFEWAFPWRCLKITPTAPKFSEELTHRDYLGSILGLGIDRSKIGDILLKQKEAYFFCQEKMAAFLAQELKSVRHTPVFVEICEEIHSLHLQPEMQELVGTVTSIRLDSVISFAFNTSRSSITSLIEGGKVFVNGKLITSNGYRLQANDIISVRGKGKFRYRTVLNQTKKGRQRIQVFRYI